MRKGRQLGEWAQRASNGDKAVVGCWQSDFSRMSFFLAHHLRGCLDLALAPPVGPTQSAPLAGTCNLVQVHPPKMASRMVMLPSKSQHASRESWLTRGCNSCPLGRKGQLFSPCSDSVPDPCPARGKSLRCLSRNSTSEEASTE